MADRFREAITCKQGTERREGDDGVKVIIKEIKEDK